MNKETDMKSTHLLAMTTAALLVTGSAFACPKKDKAPSPGAEDGVYEVSTEAAKKGNCKNKNREGNAEGVYEVAEREGDAKPERRERRERGERPEGDRKRGDHSPLRGLDLTEDQQEQVKEIMAASREQAKEVMEAVKAKKEAGEEIDREAVRAQMMEIRKSSMTKIYNDVLTEEQQAKLDKRREEMEKRRAEREGKDGERPERERKGKGEGKERGGDAGLDL
jgi:Spy/CpxP family protein refolding chaperone